MTRAAVSGVVVLLLTACSTVPGTGRSRLDLVSSHQMHQLGRRAMAQTRQHRPIVDDGPDVHRVRRITNDVVAAARRLYPRAGLPEQWDIVVVDDDSPNAFAVPGGGIGVHIGMIDVAQSDDALAVVLGHEVAHLVARHGAERMSQSLLVSGGLQVGSAVLDDEDAAVMAGLGLGATWGILMPYSRVHELEADELGLMITAEAGYDPRPAIGLWERMAGHGPDRVEFLSTHPAEQTRIDRLRVLMPAAVARWRLRSASQP